MWGLIHRKCKKELKLIIILLLRSIYVSTDVIRALTVDMQANEPT